MDPKTFFKMNAASWRKIDNWIQEQILTLEAEQRLLKPLRKPSKAKEYYKIEDEDDTQLRRRVYMTAAQVQVNKPKLSALYTMKALHSAQNKEEYPDLHLSKNYERLWQTKSWIREYTKQLYHAYMAYFTLEEEPLVEPTVKTCDQDGPRIGRMIQSFFHRLFKTKFN
jgi:hypothetical protein